MRFSNYDQLNTIIYQSSVNLVMTSFIEVPFQTQHKKQKPETKGIVNAITNVSYSQLASLSLQIADSLGDG